MLGLFGPSETVDIGGEEHLTRVKGLNSDGRSVIFAPNHIKPSSAWRQQCAFAEDYPYLKTTLAERGIDTSVLFRGDYDIPATDHTVSAWIYEAHWKIWSVIARRWIDGIPMQVNVTDPRRAHAQNQTSVREVLAKLRHTNMTIFPHGQWFEPGTQEFSEETDLAGGAFVEMGDDRWKDSLKDGVFRISRVTRAPVVPAYIDHVEEVWTIVFGKPMDPGELPIEMAKRYLETMRNLKETVKSGHIH